MLAINPLFLVFAYTYVLKYRVNIMTDAWVYPDRSEEFWEYQEVELNSRGKVDQTDMVLFLHITLHVAAALAEPQNTPFPGGLLVQLRGPPRNCSWRTKGWGSFAPWENLIAASLERMLCCKAGAKQMQALPFVWGLQGPLFVKRRFTFMVTPCALGVMSVV